MEGVAGQFQPRPQETPRASSLSQNPATAMFTSLASLPEDNRYMAQYFPLPQPKYQPFSEIEFSITNQQLTADA